LHDVMKTTLKSELYKLASSFREAIIVAIKNGDIVEENMHGFPQGCCTYASDLLQKYLYEQGIDTLLMSGIYGYGCDGESHSWLETKDGTVVDITGDQYTHKEPRFTTAVYVGTRNNGFHNLFELYDPIPYHENTGQLGHKGLEQRFLNRYEKVLKHIKTT